MIALVWLALAIDVAVVPAITPLGWKVVGGTCAVLFLLGVVGHIEHVFRLRGQAK